MTLQTTQVQPDVPAPDVRPLSDHGRIVGWTRGDQVGFVGFADATEAAWAAWAADLSLVRRQARRDRSPMPSSEAPPLALTADGSDVWITGDGRRLARLIQPGSALPVGITPDGRAAIEITVPQPATELTVSSTAHVMYRALRRSGLPWQLFARGGMLAHSSFVIEEA